MWNNLLYMENNFVYLALGTNLGDRNKNLELAVEKLNSNGIIFVDSSPIYKTPALLLKGSPDDWNKYFLNCVIKVNTKLSPIELLIVCKKIELEMGRDFSKKWAPRPIDIDILFYKNEKINFSKDYLLNYIDSDLTSKYNIQNLIVPHEAFNKRYFLNDELSFICPNSLGKNSYYGGEHQPIFMGILNITPDSFSDGGKFNNFDSFKQMFESWEKEFVSVIDIGAESTNPKAKTIEYEEELKRLSFVFEYLKNRKFSYFKPKLSIDTYHYETAKKAVKYGFDIINDVSGLADEKMLNLLKENENVKYVLTHSLSIPPSQSIVINNIGDIEAWLNEKLNLIEKNNIDKNRIIFDPGIGFGKTPIQNLKILQNIDKFQKYGLKILIGHSRKGFLKMFDNNIKTNDAETLAISLKIANKVDIIRVHTPIEHQNALLAERSLNNQYV